MSEKSINKEFEHLHWWVNEKLELFVSAHTWVETETKIGCSSLGLVSKFGSTTTQTGRMWQVSVFDPNKQHPQRVSLADVKCLHVGNKATLPQDVTWDASLQDIFVKGATRKAPTKQLNKRTKEVLEDLAQQSSTVAATDPQVRLTSSLEVSCIVRWTIIFFTNHPLRHLHPVLHRTNNPARSVATMRHSMTVSSKIVTTPNVFLKRSKPHALAHFSKDYSCIAGQESVTKFAHPIVRSAATYKDHGAPTLLVGHQWFRFPLPVKLAEAKLHPRRRTSSRCPDARRKPRRSTCRDRSRRYQGVMTLKDYSVTTKNGQG
eukprot:g36847.t1